MSNPHSAIRNPQSVYSAFRIPHSAFILAALCAVAALQPWLAKSKVYRPAFAMTDQMQEEVNTSAFATILGEVRASMADLMWVKTERYLHRGVAYKPHIDADEMAHTGQTIAEHETGGHGEHDHEKLVALVPDSATDYRGFIGTLQREIQPWKAPGSPDEHTAGDELIPWYRMLTLSDPHHWRGYLIGTWWLKGLSKDAGALTEASAFIQEGIRNNPEVFQLQLMAGRVLIQQKRYREALETFEKTAALALKTRPAGGVVKTPLWSESDEEDFDAALRYIPSLQWRMLHDPAAARASLARVQALLPADRPLQELKAQLDRAAQSK